MRPGPAPSPDATVGVRVASVRGTQVLAVDVPVKQVRVSATSDRVVTTQVQFTAPPEWVPTHPLSPLATFGQRIHLVPTVEVAGVTHDIEFGWFQIASWRESAAGVEVTALDLMQTLEEDPLPWPSSPPARATLRTELQRLAGRIPVLLEIPDRPISTELQWTTSRTASVRELCAAHGLEHAVRPDGYLHAWPTRGGGTVQATYDARDMLLDAPRTSLPRRPNRWTAVGAVGTGDDEKQLTASLETNTFPFDPAGYGVVRDRVELSGAETRADIDAAALAAMRASQSVAEARSFEIVADPRLELGDVIGAVTEAGEHVVGRVVAVSVVLDDPGSRMRVDVEALSW